MKFANYQDDQLLPEPPNLRQKPDRSSADGLGQSSGLDQNKSHNHSNRISVFKLANPKVGEENASGFLKLSVLKKRPDFSRSPLLLPHFGSFSLCLLHVVISPPRISTLLQLLLVCAV